MSDLGPQIAAAVADTITRAAQPLKTPQVRRNGEAQVIEAVTLVPGDIVLLKSGDKVPADLRIVTATNLQVGPWMGWDNLYKMGYDIIWHDMAWYDMM